MKKITAMMQGVMMTSKIINDERSITIKKISHHQMMIGDNHLMRINAKLWLENTYDDYGKANGWQIADDCEDLESTYQNNVNDVEIKPLTQEAFEIPALSKETVDLWTDLKGTRKDDCKHIFIKMDKGAAMGPYDQAIGDLCKLCGKWENVKTLRGDVEIRPNIAITSKSSLKPLSAKGMKGGDPVIVGEQHPVFDYESSNPMDMIINEWQRDREILNSLTLDKLKFDPLDTTETPKKLSLFELAKEVYKSAVGKNV